jgi:hypothetical protein
VVISPEQSVTIPFTVQVASDAAPGGHFAAILIGTKPPEASGNVKVTTSQIVTSLFFVRIAGDVTESGVIREFRSTERFISTPKADFEVRFENKGNVHLQPQGEIVITNMWGKQRGVIPINHQTHFGNVLPNSIRKFEFGWSGEPSFADIGRYKATLTLAYGSADKKFESATEYFYVVPVRATLIFFSVVIALVLLVRWSVSAYIRRMLMLSGIDPYESSAVARKRFQREGDVRIIRRVSITEPMRQSVQEVQTSIADTQEFPSLRSRYLFILKTYKLFFAGGLAILSLCSVLVFFVFSSQKDQRDFEVVITNPDAEVTLSSEDILYEEAQGEQSQTAPVAEQSFSVVLVNSSDTPGTAAAFAPQLQSLGYTISDLRSDFGAVKARSVIVYAPALAEEALDLSKKIGGVLLSADVATSTDRLGDIILYIGNDLVE